RFGTAEDITTLNSLIWTCSMGASNSDWSAVLKIAARAAEKEPTNRHLQNSWGAALYRAGQFEAARAHFLNSLDIGDRDWDVFDWLMLAMTDSKLSRPEDAHAWLAKADEYFDLPSSTEQNWDDRMDLRLLRKEAKEVLRSR